MNLTIINRANGSVDVHKAGCRDIKRSIAKDGVFGEDSPWTEEFSSKREAFLAYNEDFIAEADGDEGNAYPLNFLPCANIPD